MKISFALFVLICVVGVHVGHAHNTDPRQIAKIKPHLEECARMTNFDQNELNKIVIGQDPTWSNDLDCFLACVLKRTGIMNADGSINYRPDDSDVAKKCKDRRGIHACDTAAKVMACLDKNKIMIFF